MDEYLAMWKNYFNFNSRTTVKGFWMAVLFNFIIAIVLSCLVMVHEMFSIVSGLYSLAVLIPSLALEVRRLHDINKAGWWVLISLVPCIGTILLIVWFCMGSVDAGNRFGSEQV